MGKEQSAAEEGVFFSEGKGYFDEMSSFDL